ncbi:MAG: SBBP repeat-containing protein [Candidatus Hodarchaeota archaeon]
MVKSISKISFLFVLLILLSIQSSISLETKNQDPHQQASTILEISPDYGKIPLYFIPNEGQVDEKALFYAKTSRYTLWLTEEGLVFDSVKRIKKGENESRLQHPKDRNNPEGFTFERDVSRLVFLNSKKNPEVVPVDRTEHKVNYFIGKDKSKWRTGIQTSGAVLYKELYRDIDLRVYGIEKQIEYDFIVRPGGEVSDIGFEYRDVVRTEIDKDGNLVIETKFGELEHAKPKCYQVIGGEKVDVEARFKKIRTNTYGFNIAEYNRDYELIIDPMVLVYSTYLGGSDYDCDGCRGIAVDLEGAAYVTGWTYSDDFPTQNPIQGTNAGLSDIFITKVSSSGSELVYSTYLGGYYSDEGWGIAVDSQGAAYVAGSTSSDDFPIQNPLQGSRVVGDDIFITKVSSSGSELVYSTYLGGSGHDYGRGIAVDSQGAAYVTGWTSSADFPIQNPIQGTNAGPYDVFIAKLSSSGAALVYSTYLGGSERDWGMSIAVDSQGAAYVTGWTDSADFPTQNPIQGSNAAGNDIFITKVNSSGSELVYSTYLGGSGSDDGRVIAVDLQGAAYVTGFTNSIDFPTQNPIQGTNAGLSDIFITKVSSSGSELVYSTYLGGSSYDSGWGIAVDSQGAACVAGYTESVNFPTHSPIQGTKAGYYDVFITKVNSSGSALVYSTYLGGSGDDVGWSIALDSQGAACVAGYTQSSANFPTQNPIQGNYAGYTDAFIAKLNFSGPVTYSITITAGSGGTTVPSPGTYTYDEATEVTIRAIPNTGYTFSGWSGNASGTTNPITITINYDKSINANFSRISTGDGETEKKGGCFIATAAYNSPFHPHIDTLRDFRDKYLMPSKLGRKFVSLYYKYSPSLANFIAKHKILKLVIRISLLPLVAISYSMVHLGPIITGVMFFLILVLAIFLISFYRRN